MYFFPLNTINKKKGAMRQTMRKSQDLQSKRFAARLTELKNYPPLFQVFIFTKKMDPEDLNNILLRVVPNAWA